MLHIPARLEGWLEKHLAGEEVSVLHTAFDRLIWLIASGGITAYSLRPEYDRLGTRSVVLNGFRFYVHFSKRRGKVVLSRVEHQTPSPRGFGATLVRAASVVPVRKMDRLFQAAMHMMKLAEYRQLTEMATIVASANIYRVTREGFDFYFRDDQDGGPWCLVDVAPERARLAVGDRSKYMQGLEYGFGTPVAAGHGRRRRVWITPDGLVRLQRQHWGTRVAPNWAVRTPWAVFPAPVKALKVEVRGMVWRTGETAQTWRIDALRAYRLLTYRAKSAR